MVTDEQGKSLSRVEIRSLRSIRDWTETSDAGVFTVQEVPAKLLILSVGYVPVLQEFGGGPNEAVIKLEKVKPDDQISISACGDLHTFARKTRAYNTVGEYFVLPLLKNEKVRRGKDVDYQEYIVTFKSSSKPQFLRQIVGPNASSGFPFRDWIQEAREIKIRLILFNEERIGEDWRGVSESGKTWRYVRIFDESLRYETAGPDAVEFFNKLLSRACINSDHPLIKNSGTK